MIRITEFLGFILFCGSSVLLPEYLLKRGKQRCRNTEHDCGKNKTLYRGEMRMAA